MAKAYLVIRIKGQADVPHWANTTLNLLKLEKKYRAIILPVKENTEGMKKITSEDISKAGFKTIDELATSLSEGKTSMTKLKSLKPWFALSPPKHGFKRSTKRLYGQKGILGHNKELTTLVKRMM